MKIIQQSDSDCRSSQSAFTLTEVLVALLVLSIVVVSLYTGVSSGFALVKLAREDLRATQIMLQRVEALRLYTWSQFTDPGYFSTNNCEAYFDPAGQGNGSGGAVYTVSTTITTNTPPASYTPDMRRVTVQVSWLSGPITRHREMSTYVARYGMQNYIFGPPVQ
jgi:prepilin-type N-terminal cleavage/methylation domain-containing protein